MHSGYREEGDVCPEIECGGILGFREVENCSCHISPPCEACTDNPLRCPKCGWTDEDEPQERVVYAAPGLSSIEYKPQPLDRTKIDYRIKPHSSCSQLCEGVYPPGATRTEVEAVVRGTFGGRFESFGNGNFRYIAYTD